MNRYNVYVGSLRAFLQVDWRKHNNQWVKMPFVIHANSSSISTALAPLSENQRNNFNLQGQRIKTLQKGLNIVDGKKVFVK